MSAPQGWAVSTISDLIGPDGVFVDGDWIETKDQDPEGEVRLIQLADIGNGVFQSRSHRFLTLATAHRLDCTFLNPGDVLVARMPEPLGRAAIFPGDLHPCITAVDICIIRAGSDGANHRWLVSAINSPQFRERVARLQKGVTRKRISRSNLATIELPLPPIQEQSRIAAEIEKQLTRLDAAVAALKRVQGNLKRYRAAVLKAACEGRLVPTEAELARKEGRPYESADQLLARILHERRAKWEADQLAKMLAAGKPPKDDSWKRKYQEPEPPDISNLPRLPEGWIWTSLGQAFEVYVGATPSRAKPRFWNGTIPWVSSGEVAFCRIHMTRELITEEGLANSSTQLHPAGTVLLGMIGEGKTRGQSAILDIAACNNQNCAAIRVSRAGLPPEYLYRYLESEYERTRTIGSGNNQPALNKTRVEQMVFPLPPIAEQYRIVTELERRLSLIDALATQARHSLAHAVRLRQSILKRAFEGKLVPQDPTDEPASVLLERIRAERAAKPQKAPRPRRRPANVLEATATK